MKDVDGKLKKATMQLSELELFKERMQSDNPKRHDINTNVSEINLAILRIERLRDCVEGLRKPSMVAQVVDGRFTDFLVGGLQEMSSSTIEEVLTFVCGKILDHSPLYLFKFVSLADEALDGMVSFYALHEAIADKYSIDRFLTVQRNMLFKWFDALRSIKKVDGIGQNLPKNLYQPSMLRIGVEMLFVFLSFWPAVVVYISCWAGGTLQDWSCEG